MTDISPSLTLEWTEPDANVLFVTNMWPDDERPVYGIFVKRQIESLRTKGIRCDVLYVRGYMGFRCYIAAFAWFLSNRRMLRSKYRLVHAHAGETALVVAPLVGMPLVSSYCGDDILGKALPDGRFTVRGRVRRWLLKQSARFARRTITKSREMAAALPRSLQNTNSVVPNGIDDTEFRPMDREQARQGLGWEKDEKIVIFVATRPHEPRKRLDLARAAIAEAESTVGPIQLFVAENVAPRDLPQIMNAADCLLLTSRMEGSPNAVKEAMMCNLPVVSTDVGDVAELLEGVRNSAVPADEPAALGKALVDILSTRERSNAREIHADLRESEIATRIFEIYGEAGSPPLIDQPQSSVSAVEPSG